jgi:hypothetical protein
MTLRQNRLPFPSLVANTNPNRTLLLGLVALLKRREIPYEVITYRLRIAPQSTTNLAIAQQEFPIRKGHVFLTGLWNTTQAPGVGMDLDSLSVSNRNITAGNLSSDRMLASRGTSNEVEWPFPVRINAGDTLNVGSHDPGASSTVQFLQMEVVHVPQTPQAMQKLRDIPTLEFFELGAADIPTGQTLDQNREYTFDGPGELYAYVYDDGPGGPISETIVANLRINDEPLWGEPITSTNPLAIANVLTQPAAHLHRPVAQGERLYLDVSNASGIDRTFILQFMFLRPWR